ncbi:hypothetical protein B0J13DRAFT_262602 [Dactylonectria estremocensis]|uniref:Uncharacterized protein n=1 Tax=Dactylonectria estremocensis TaxID=1079267 RepID=A0A9P9F533_9HYPO|nr:hypothetical protein B0J13DRAFT_262602 [Dactylonectria estremocensis]
MDSGNWDTERAADIWQRDSSDGFRFETNTTSAWDNELKFAAAESVRTSIIVLAGFNAAAAFVTATGILWKTWTTTKRNDPSWNPRTSWLKVIGPAELFPFVLSCGITVQGIVFTTSQYTGLQALMVLGCTKTSQLMLPAFFITPFLQVAFGMELTIRALKRRSFQPRWRWSTLICLVVVGILLLVTFVVTFVVRPPNFCFACLVWFLQHYKLACFAILIAAVVILLVQVAIISVRLLKVTNIGPAERTEASRMVYFLVVAVVTNALLIPFFFSVSFGQVDSDRTVKTSMVAAVVVNLSGLLTGSLYLFLRSSRTSTIGCSDWDGIENRTFEKGFWDGGSSNFDFGLQIAQPLAPPQNRRSDNGSTIILETPDMGRGLETPVSGGNIHVPSLGIICPPTNLPQEPEPAQVTTKLTLKAFTKSWYNKLPGAGDPLMPKSNFFLPTTTYAPPPPLEDVAMGSTDNLLAPPAIHEPGHLHHQRGSSMLSSATVQIGLRLSNVGDMPPPTSTFPEDLGKVHDLDCPDTAMPMSSLKSSPLGITVITLPDEEAIEEQRNKRLPPTPAGGSRDEERDEVMTLSPDVYSPPSQRMNHYRTGSRSSHRSKTSASSRAPHSRTGSRAGPDVIKEDWI